MKSKVFRCVEETGIVAVVRGTKPAEIVRVAQALYDGGVRAVEVTCNTKGYLRMIEALSEAFSGKMFIGAGTVLSPAAAQMVIDAGANFVLAPNLDPEVIQIVHQQGKLMIPGVTTPSEAVAAYRMGVDIIKLFPAGTLGPRYVKDILGPLNHALIMPVGGINLTNLPEFVAAGAFAFGVGSELVDKTAIAAGNFAAITEKARLFVNTFKQSKGLDDAK